jgi:hypothetical protein
MHVKGAWSSVDSDLDVMRVLAMTIDVKDDLYEQRRKWSAA